MHYFWYSPRIQQLLKVQFVNNTQERIDTDLLLYYVFISQKPFPRIYLDILLPLSQVWPGVDKKYELYQKMELPKGQKRKVKERLKAYVKDPYALDLIDKLLVLDPAQRVDSDDALNHDFFWSDPMPSDLKHMLSTHNTSMFEYLAPPRRRGHMPQQPANQNRNPATTSQSEFDRVF